MHFENNKNIIGAAVLLLTFSLTACGGSRGDSVSGAGVPFEAGDGADTDVTAFTGSNYEEAYGLPVSDDENITCDGIVYYGVSPSEYNRVVTCEIKKGDVISVSSDGFTQMTIPITLTMEGEYTDECISYTSAVTPSIDIADRYTGLIIPTEDLSGDDGLSYSVSLPFNDGTIDISIACDVTDTVSEYRTLDDGRYVCDIIFNVTYTIMEPEGYDGLIFKIAPVREYIPETEKTDGDISGSECILDDYPDGTVLMEIY